MSKQSLAIDIDEVIFPLVDDLIKYVDKEHKVFLSTDGFVKYRIEDIWPSGPEEGGRVFQDYLKQSGIEIAPVKGAKEALDKLSQTFDLIVMTYRDVERGKETEYWLNHNFPELFKKVHMLGSTEKDFQYKSKGEVCKELNVYCLIDDQPANVISAHEHGVKSILFGDYPWNQTDELPHAIPRVRNWEEAMDILL